MACMLQNDMYAFLTLKEKIIMAVNIELIILN